MITPYVESVIWPIIRDLGRGVVLRTGQVAQLLGYKRRQVYNFFAQLEAAGLITRNQNGRVWRIA